MFQYIVNIFTVVHFLLFTKPQRVIRGDTFSTFDFEMVRPSPRLRDAGRSCRRLSHASPPPRPCFTRALRLCRCCGNRWT